MQFLSLQVELRQERHIYSPRHRGGQAPSGAACQDRTVQRADMPLPTELERTLEGPRFYKPAAPNGAVRHVPRYEVSRLRPLGAHEWAHLASTAVAQTSSLLYRGFPIRRCGQAVTACRLGSRRYSRFGNVRYQREHPGDWWYWQDAPPRVPGTLSSCGGHGAHGRLARREICR